MSSHAHPLNSSSAKQKYSFSKSRRFHAVKPKTDVYYKIQMIPDKRSAIIGHGKRSLFMYEDSQLINKPHAYSIPSFINDKRGYSFKPGRHNLGSPLEEAIRSFAPPPNKYNQHSTLELNKGPSLKARLPDNTLKYLKGIPGPGSYSIPSSLGNGNKMVVESKFSSPSSIRLVKPYQSLQLKRHENPSPAQYDILKYGLSNPQSPLNNIRNVKIGSSNRGKVTIQGSEKVPGPGQYKVYSQFDY